jgi:hypothetical protein
VAIRHETSGSAGNLTVADLQGHLECETGGADGPWLEIIHPAENFSQPLTIKFAVSRRAEFLSAEEPESADFFAAIEAAHALP